MARSRFAIFLLVISCVSLSACGGGGGGSSDSSDSARQSASADSSAEIGSDDSAAAVTPDNPDAPVESTDPETGQTNDSDSTPPVIPPASSGSDTDTDSQPKTDTPSDTGSPVDANSVPEQGSGDVQDSSEPDVAPSPGDTVDITPQDPPEQSTGPWAAAPTVSFQAVSENGQSQQDVPVTIGQVFAQGAVPEGQSVVAVVDGQRIPAQVDKKATWADGSLRHAIVTVRMDSVSANTPSVVSLHNTNASESGARLTISQLLATSFDAVISIEKEGVTYTASARDLLYKAAADGCASWGSSCKRWLSGPLASEWVVGGTPAANGVVMPNLNIYFNVRAYAGSNGMVDRVRVDFVVENDRAYDSQLQNVSYNATLTTGNQRYSVNDLTHYTRARWHRVLWWQGKPNVYAQVDTRYLQETGAISRYADLNPSDSFLNDLPAEYAPMKNGAQTEAMGTTGAQAGIGPLPRWTSVYAVSGDSRAFHWMLANDDAVGSYGFHFRDEQTGRPLDIITRPYVTIANLSWARQSNNQKFKKDLLPRCSGTCSSPYTFNISHHPSIGYVPYLVTGDYYYLEEMQFAGSYVELWANEGYRQHDYGRLRGAQRQVRGQAWGLRSISDAAFATPDDDPLKVYFTSMMRNIIEDYTQFFIDGDQTVNPLHVIRNRGAVLYDTHSEENVALAPWQQDFFVWSLGHAADQDFDGAAELLAWFSTFEIARMTDWLDHKDGYCWQQAAIYKMQIRDTEDASDYASMALVYAANEPDLVGLECNSQEMANLWSDGRYDVGEMSGYADSPTGFPSNFQVGLAMAASTDLPNAAAAWRIFASRNVQPDYSDYPNFAVIPRN